MQDCLGVVIRLFLFASVWQSCLCFTADQPDRLEWPLDARIINTAEYINRDLGFLDPPRNKGVWTQGWDIDYTKSDKYNTQMKAFAVMHSHNDPGWIKTFEEYYLTSTKGILKTVTERLYNNPDYKFIWAEISFFQLWWRDQDQAVKEKVKTIVERGQLEFVTGGWVMNDEACAYYYAIINQLLDGHEWLQENLNYKPRYGWSIDPFGHSSTQAFLYALAEFSGMLIQRTHYAVKRDFAWNRTLEFLWIPEFLHQNKIYKDVEPEWRMMTHMMPFFSYDFPHTCGPEPRVCNELDWRPSHKDHWKTKWLPKNNPLTERNIGSNSLKLLSQVRKKSTLFQTGNVLIPHGDDFSYSNKDEFDGIAIPHQKIHNWINANASLHTQINFSTLSEYFNSMHSDAVSTGVTFPKVVGDFFTYADEGDHYWSGYYTSRVFYKSMDRILEANLRTATLLYAYAMNSPEPVSFAQLKEASQALSLFQHHDGITGTAKSKVVEDYSNRLFTGITSCLSIISNMTSKIQNSLTQLEAVTPGGGYKDLMKPSLITIEKGKCKHLTFFNSLSFFKSEVVSVNVNTNMIDIRNPNESDEVVKFQLQDALNLKHGGKLPVYTLEILVEFIPPMGFKTLSVCAPETVPEIKYASPSEVSSDSFQLSNSHYRFTLASKSGLITSWKKKTSSNEIQFQEFLGEYSTTKSGMYLFMPTGAAVPLSDGVAQKIHLVSGSLYDRAYAFYPNLVRKITVYKTGIDHIDKSPAISYHLFNWTDNRETIARFETNMKTKKEFYTDLNGFQLQKRYRRDDQPTQFNFFPATSSVYQEDENQRFTVLVKQSESVGSTKDGSLEFLLDRKLTQDDHLGLYEIISDHVQGTQIHFNLLLEEFVHSKGNDFDQELSWQAQKTSLNQLNPAIVMRSDQPVNILTPSLVDYPALPETLHIVNFRRRNTASQDSILQLLLHATSPRFEQPNRKQSQMKIDIFTKPGFRYGHQYSLTMLHEKDETYQSGDQISILPKEIKTILTSWNSSQPVAGPDSANLPQKERQRQRSLGPIKISLGSDKNSPIAGPPMAVWFLTFVSYFLVFVIGVLTNRKFFAIFILMLLHLFNSVGLFLLSKPSPEFSIA